MSWRSARKEVRLLVGEPGASDHGSGISKKVAETDADRLATGRQVIRLTPGMPHRPST